MSPPNEPGGESRRAVRVGEVVFFRLPENPTTGYVWEFQQTGTGALRVAENKFEPGSPDAGAPAPGSGGQRVLQLVGERAGTVQLQAVQRRSWEPPEKAIDTRSFTVDVV